MLQCALVRLWESWGVRPAVVLGHSAGECAAAWAAGVFSFEAGLKFVAERARLFQALPRDGGMLSLRADLSIAQELLRPHAGLVDVAAVNSPRNTVVSGAREALAAVSTECKRRRIPARMLNVSHAFHSAAMSAIGDDLMRAAREVEYREPQVPIVSTITGHLAPEGAMSSPEYWARQLLMPVKFSDGIRALAPADSHVFLEIGPHPTLVTFGQETLTGSASPDGWLHSLRQQFDDWQEMLGALGRLYLRGVDVDWKGFDRDYGRSWVAVPGYPFQRQRFWPERPARALPGALKREDPPSAAPTYDDALLGRRLHSPGLADIVFENRFSGGHPAFLSDHKIYSMVVVPGAAHLAMLAAVAGRLGIENPVELREVTFPEGMILAEGEVRLVQLLLSAEQEGVHLFKIVSARDDGEPSWIVHSAGKLVGSRGDAAVTGEASTQPEAIGDAQRRCGDHLTNAKMFYRLLAQSGIELGPNFQWIEEIWRCPGEAVARLREARPEDRVDIYPIHPGWIDACFQLLTVALTKMDPGFATYLPISVGRFVLFGRPSSSPWVQVTLRPKADVFEGPVEIVSTRIGRDLRARHTKFGGSDIALTVEGARIGGSADLTYSIMKGAVLVARSEVTALEASIIPRDVEEESLVIPELTIMDSNIRWLLMLEGFKVGRFTLKKAEVGEKAEVGDVTVMDKGEITGVNVKELRLNGVSWPTSKTEVILEGNKYTDIVVGSKNEKSSWETVVRLFEGAVYNQENYATYEKVLRKQGLVEEADNVYMARRDRELSEMLVGWSYAKNLFLGVLAGYGKNPEYAFYWSIVVVVLGCWVFKRQRMRPVDG